MTSDCLPHQVGPHSGCKRRCWRSGRRSGRRLGCSLHTSMQSGGYARDAGATPRTPPLVKASATPRTPPLVKASDLAGRSSPRPPPYKRSRMAAAWAPCWAARTISMMRCIIERALAQAPTRSARGVPRHGRCCHRPGPSHTCLRSPHTIPHTIPSRTSSEGNLQSLPAPIPCALHAMHAHPTAPPAVEEPSIVSWRPTRRPQPSNQASSPAAALPTMPRGPTSPIHPPKIHLATVSRASRSPDECEFTEDLPTTTPRARRPPPCGILPTASSSSRQALPGVPTRL